MRWLPFFSTHKDACAYDISVVVDSWNCIKKYKDVENTFIIFDEDKVTGTGAWVKAFLKMTRGIGNQWIILSATPGDCFMDYAAVFVANGYFKNISQFKDQHVVYNPFVRFPQIDRYTDIPKLNRLRRNVLVEMPFKRNREVHNEHIFCDFDRERYKSICRDRWNPFTDEPIENASQFCYALRRASNDSSSRELAVLEIFEKQPKLIIFYNFDYELEALLGLCEGLPGVVVAQWNGHAHEELPCKEEKWLYLVQYNAAAEAWNTVATDTIIFYSQTYSYKTLIQAQGRIDRLNSPFRDLYYYHLLSRSGIDLSIKAALDKKKKFNESRFCGDIFKTNP